MRLPNATFRQMRGLLFAGMMLQLAFGPVWAEEKTMDTPIQIDDRLELFVDRLLVETMTGVEFKLHSPQKLSLPKNPLPEAHFATVIKDGDMYRAYYRDTDPSYTGRRYSGHPGEITCTAESRDGHEWTFPNLGLFDVNGTRENNVILAGMPPCSHNFAPFLDTRPGVDESERFKALAGHPGYNRRVEAEGLHAFASADGIRWRKLSDAPVIPYDKSWSHAFDSQNVAFWSEAEQVYVAYFRTWTRYSGQPGEAPERRESGQGLRSISRVTSPDFRNWSTPVAMQPNLPGEHLYTNQTHPYFRAPHIYVALPSRYVAGRVGGEAKDAMQGSTDILFMTSRAGATRYDRLFTEAFIRPGLDPERWASRANYVALNVVPTGPTEMSIYHRSGHRYVLRTDGFISLHAGAAPGEVVTQPLSFSGAELVMNYSTSAAGSLRVEIQDAAGKPIPGFALADSPANVGDAIEHRIAWQDDPDLAALAGTPVRLRFEMKECDVYAFRFRGGGEEPQNP